MLTHGSRTDGSEAVEDQSFASLSNLGEALLHSIVVKGPWPAETPRAPPRRKGASPKTKRRKRKKGGWRARKGLTWAQVKEVFEFAKLARQAGFPLNAFFTIKADKRCSTDQERKRDLSRKIAHLGQAIKGRGERHARHISSASPPTRKSAAAFSTLMCSSMSRISLLPSNSRMATSST